MKILITGANGMLGSSLCRLYSGAHEVFALHRDTKCYASRAADYRVDLLDMHTLSNIFRQIGPDLVIHCAGLTDVDQCEKNPEMAYDANVTATKNVAQLSANDMKLICISSDQVYGHSEDRSEMNSDLRPVNVYGMTKLQGEQEAKGHARHHMVIRTNIFGWNVKPGKMGSAEWIIDSLKTGTPITLFEDYIFSPIYTTCLGEIILELVKIGFCGVINAGSPTAVSKYEFGTHLAEVFGLDRSLIVKGSISEHAFKAPRPRNLSLNTRRLSDLCVAIPDYRTSTKRFYNETPENA